MRDLRQDIAELICHGEAVLNPRKWLAQEAGDLATRIAGLDAIPSQAIVPLAKLVAYGESDARRLALSTDFDESKLEEYLGALCEFKFAEQTWNGYKATSTGEQAFEAIGRRMVDRELMQLQGRLQQLERIHQKLNGS